MEPATSPPPSEPQEIEFKLHASEASASLLWTHPLVVELAIGPKRVARLDNRYFDTPERDLAGRRMALRLRRVGRTWLQTLKGSGTEDGALSVRSEWEAPVAGPALKLTKLRDTPLASIASLRALSRRLQPVFTTNFRRESRELRLKDGCEVELALDTGWISSGRGRAARSLPIREIELEVKVRGTDDPAAALLRFARRLVRDLPLLPLAESKAARGYRLADGRAVAPSRVRLPTPDADGSASRYLARVIASCTDALLDNAHGMMEERHAARGDPEFVHQARVAIRRLRSALRTFRPIAKGRRFDELETRLQSLGQSFGRARDWDVFAANTVKRLEDRVGKDEAAREAIVELKAIVEAHRGEAYRVLLAELDGGPFGALAIDLIRIAKGIEDDAAAKPGPALADCVPRWLAEQRDRIVRQARRIAVLDAEQRHGLRVEVKRLRYGLDLFEALYDPALVEPFHDALAELQTRLGRINDEMVAGRLLQSFEQDAIRTLITARHTAWLDQHIPKQLPKVAALSVAFELTRAPWSGEPSRGSG